MTDALLSEVLSVLCVVARFAPVVFLCPLFGGVLAPTSTRLAVALSLGWAAHLALGNAKPFSLTAVSVARIFGGELLWGVALGLVVRAPFLAAETAGLFSDLARGASGESALPGIGSKEASLGVLLQNALNALLALGSGFPVVLRLLWGSVRTFPPGASALSPEHWVSVAAILGTGLATGVALAVPAIVAAWLVDATAAIAGRALPGLALVENAAPVRLAAGAAVVTLTFATSLSDLVLFAQTTVEAFTSTLGFAP